MLHIQVYCKDSTTKLLNFIDMLIQITMIKSKTHACLTTYRNEFLPMFHPCVRS